MKAKDLSGMTFGSLFVVEFDSARHDEDVAKRKNGEIGRVRRYYVCKCNLCGNIISVRGENLSSGNTNGCGCDAVQKSVSRRHNNKLNKYEYDQDMACYKGYATNSGTEFLFDADDFDTVSKYCWYETKEGYIMTRVSRSELVFLHRMIMFGSDAKNTPEYVDHINRVRTDCRRSNLRKCTPLENVRNRTVRHDSTTGEIGVRLYKPSGKWNAYIHVDGKWKSLGYYDTKDAAVSARKDAEKRIFGEFRPQ